MKHTYQEGTIINVTNCNRSGQMGRVLRNSCPRMTYPTFSFPLMEDLISPSTNSSPRRTDTRTHPHSSPTPHASETRSVPILDASSCFTPFVINPFRSSTGPSVHWSPFRISYALPFSFRSRSASVTQHRLFVPFPLSTSYDFLVSFLIGSAMW